MVSAIAASSGRAVNSVKLVEDGMYACPLDSDSDILHDHKFLRSSSFKYIRDRDALVFERPQHF